MICNYTGLLKLEIWISRTIALVLDCDTNWNDVYLKLASILSYVWDIPILIFRLAWLQRFLEIMLTYVLCFVIVSRFYGS